MNTELIIDTNFNTVDYGVIVEAIVDGYFDDIGEYSPYLGRINTIALFYNFCVKQSKFEEELGHNIKDLIHVNTLIADNEFMSKYDEVMHVAKNDFSLTFRGAYDDAIKIIEHRKGNIATVIKFISDLRLEGTKQIMSIADDQSNISEQSDNTQDDKTTSTESKAKSNYKNDNEEDGD